MSSENVTQGALTPVPEAWVSRLSEVSARCFGAADLSGAALAQAVAEVSRLYTLERHELGARPMSKAALVARLKWFCVRDLPKVEAPLLELAHAGLAPAPGAWRVLDIGAGVGTTTLGLSRFAAQHGGSSLHVDAWDLDGEALRVFGEVARDVTALGGSPIFLRTHTGDVDDAARVLRSLDGERAQVITVGLVINELWPALEPARRIERIADWLTTLSAALTDDGVLIVIEPALREQTRALQQVRDVLAARASAPFVVAPCLHRAACPMLDNPRDWCHAQVPFALPSSAAEVARHAGLRDHDLTFSYLSVRRDPRPLAAATTPAGLAIQRIVSSPLSSKGKRELIVCAQGGLYRAMRLDRHRSEANASFADLGRGSIVALPQPAAGRIRVGADDAVEPQWTWSHGSLANRLISPMPVQDMRDPR